MSSIEVFRRIVTALNQAGIAYMLTGSFASAYYGAPRSTQDIDLVIEATPAQLQNFIGSLPAKDYYADLDAALEACSRRSMFNVIDLGTGWKIDFILRKARAFSETEFARRQPVDHLGLQLFIASAEDVVIAKLEWSKLAQSRRQVEDAAAILRVRRESLDRPYLEKWVRELGVEKEWEAARE